MNITEQAPLILVRGDLQAALNSDLIFSISTALNSCNSLRIGSIGIITFLLFFGAFLVETTNILGPQSLNARLAKFMNSQVSGCVRVHSKNLETQVHHSLVRNVAGEFC